MSEPLLILITGASGYIGSSIIVHLLDAGYRVRGTARGKKLDLLRSYFRTNPNFEAVEIQDVASSDFTSALQGVGAIIHAACPLPGNAPPDVTLKSARQGALNVLEQAIKAGVYKVVMTSSWSTFFDPDFQPYTGATVTEKDWGHTTDDDVLNGNRNGNGVLYIYRGAKILSEKAAWKFAEEHPELDLAIINPPFVYGKPIPGLFVFESIFSLGTNLLIYRLIDGPAGRPLPAQVPPGWIHIHDVVRAHLAALRLPKLPPGTNVQEKRFLLAGPGPLLWTDAVKILLSERPALKNRLPSLENVPPLPGPPSTNDTTRAKEVLGITEYHSLTETLLETVDALLEMEKAWKVADRPEQVLAARL